MLQRHLILLEVKLRTVHTPTDTTQSHVQKRPYASETAFLATEQWSHQMTKQFSEMC